MIEQEYIVFPDMLPLLNMEAQNRNNTVPRRGLFLNWARHGATSVYNASLLRDSWDRIH